MSFTRGLACPEHGDGGGGACPCRAATAAWSLFTAAEWGAMARVRQRVARDGARAVVRAVDSGGYTMLHYAAQHGRADVVAFLLEIGAEADARAPGSTPLMRASYSGHEDCVRMLLEAGASAKLQDGLFGETALHKAARQGHDEIVAVLRAHDPDCAQIRDLAGKLFSDPRSTPAALEPNMGGETLSPPAEPSAQQAAPAAQDRAALGEGQVRAGMACPLCSAHVLRMQRMPCCAALVCQKCIRDPQQRTANGCALCESSP